MTFSYNNLYVVYVTNFLKCHWDVTMMLFFYALTSLYMFTVQQVITILYLPVSNMPKKTKCFIWTIQN